MRATDAYRELAGLDRAVVTSREAATRWRASAQTTYRRLHALEEAGLIKQLRRGLWALDPTVEPFAVAPFLTAPYPSYVSLWSALYRHGMIEQIPRTITVASLRRPGRAVTTVGVFEIHQLAPGVFGGFEDLGPGGYLATPAKALFDTVYVRAAAGSKAFFPELELPRGFDRGELDHWKGEVAGKRLGTLVGEHLEQVLANADALAEAGS